MNLNLKTNKSDRINEAGMPSQEQWFIKNMSDRIFSWMSEVYEDWGGLESVSPDAIKDFSNRNDYEESLERFAHDFNVDMDYLRPLMDKAVDMAYERLKEWDMETNEAKLRKVIREHLKRVLFKK